MTTTPVKKNLSRLAIVGLFALFIGPFALAWYLFNHHDSLTWSTVNHGTLITPTIKTTDLGLQGQKWHILFLTDGACEQQCQHQQDLIIRLWLAMGKRKDQIIPEMLTTFKEDNHFLALSKKRFPDLIISYFPQDNLATLETQLSQDTLPTLSPENFYLADRRGHIMMAYAANTNPKAIISDLKRLIKG